MNILVTLNQGYIRPLCTMLYSLSLAHPDTVLDVYVMNKSFTDDDYSFIYKNIKSENIVLHDIKVDDSMLRDAPVTDRYPLEMYYRIFASKFLPENLDKILYLDPDLVVLKNLSELYNTELADNFYAAASHVSRPLQKFNEIRLQMDTKGPYINSGVMLMNLKLLRRKQDFVRVFEYIDKNKNVLFLPDQDIISAVYSEKIITVDPYIYNMTERMLHSPKSIKNCIDAEWVDKNSAIIHYCGRNKPWKCNYTGCLDKYYRYFSEGTGSR
ncbi:MAG: glycosyltransferase family 8 protein [Oscillospiraceae bacterium]|nr:glycosyltransferase family 8 protein [Oscillospiraceae bacterium]